MHDDEESEDWVGVQDDGKDNLVVNKGLIVRLKRASDQYREYRGRPAWIHEITGQALHYAGAYEAGGRSVLALGGRSPQEHGEYREESNGYGNGYGNSKLFYGDSKFFHGDGKLC